MKKLKKIISIFALISIIALPLSNISAAQTLKERDDAAKLRYNEARQTYLNEVNIYKTARQNFLNAKTKFKKLRNVENKAEYKLAAQEFLSRAVSTLIKYLEALKSKAENVRSIAEEDRTNIISDINKDIDWLSGEQLKLSGELSDEELKTEALAISNYWTTIKTTFKKSVVEIWIVRVAFVIEKAEDFSGRVNDKIQELKAVGYDTAKLETWLADLNRNISSAKEKVEFAKEKRATISEVNMNQMAKETNQFIKDANQYIRKSHSTLVQIIQEMKQMAKTEADK